MSEATSARMFLRHATADLHAELDSLFSRTDFDDRASYADFLSRQAAPLFAIEAAIEGSPADMPVADWSERRRASAMLRDLAALHVAPPAAVRAPSTFASPDAVLGALYVLEGSRLGGKLLARQARMSRDATVRDAIAYLSHGEAKRFWPDFLEVLARREAEGLDRAALVDGARMAFALFLTSAKKDR